MADDSFDRMKENAQEGYGKAKASARANAKQSFEAHRPKKTES
jgi:hypothetical protein